MIEMSSAGGHYLHLSEPGCPSHLVLLPQFLLYFPIRAINSDDFSVRYRFACDQYLVIALRYHSSSDVYVVMVLQFDHFQLFDIS